MNWHLYLTLSLKNWTEWQLLLNHRLLCSNIIHEEMNKSLGKNLQWVNFLVLSLCHNILHVVVTNNCTLIYNLNVTCTLFQVAKAFFSETGITRCNRLSARYIQKCLSEKNHITGDMSANLPIETPYNN
jgi:hypothetical protein